ncbi:zinc finger protein 678-like [Odontomachus brunneus]|uniref:zinc finger protein 678-like n=1 Tax=Odontomachus brunneus TaxID=486640 RepID=UPI0013F28FBB|nr:zinc finger protein 678-like [Odontomachus brunneus]XP_032672954.1 zinc finger protein 678-like [Odontomachus brunneus]XP_032672964.1 zinc finger protein 678-like [Odontomachus brunneus]XP_032672974.1 zinc finger protein 678-like [Odontomachus brunneus]XP_032672984.1 zinc finger protein 678-like [Odontomachus brunneus]
MTSGYFTLPLNMDRVCRICLAEGTNLSPIFSTDQEVNDFPGLSQKIQVCGSIEIHEQDGLPSLICDVCAYKARVAHEFRQQCQHSDARLRMYYNKPAKGNITDSCTQTDLRTRFVLPTKPNHLQEEYFVKENMQVVTNPQEYVQPTDSFPRHETSLNTSQIHMQDEKLFMCSIGFEGSKEEAVKNPCITENVVHEITITQQDAHDTSIVNLQMKDDEVVKETEQYVEKSDAQEQEQFVSESLPDNNMEEEVEEEEENVPQKRTSARKTKSAPVKTYSDDEIGDTYYDLSSDSQDSVESKFKCKICSKQYATQKGLKKHSLVHEKKYKCNVCLKMFYKQENMENHQKIHASKPHACQLCHACFSKPQSLVKHLKSHTEKVNNMIKQINTDERKDNKEPKKELKSDEDTDDETGPANEVDEFENAPELYKCEICSQYCSSLKNLRRHALVHGDKKYSCTVCKKWFFRPDTLKKHAEKHGHGLLDNLVDDNKLYDSDDDEMAPTNNAVNPSSENENVKKEDSDEDGSGEYKCQHCDKVMATKKGLRRHVSMHKPKAEPVTCEICRKVCASQARLVLHQRTHKPKEKVPREYLCHICSKVYPSNSSLTYHMRTHTGVKPHVCKTCNSGFTTTTSLANHIRIHTGDKPYVCHVCSAAFAVSSAFRRHLTRHTGEANYLCKTCGKAFKRLSTLKEHTYTHSGEKPYVCKTCGAAYSHSGSLFAHQKRCRAQYSEMIVEDHHHHHMPHTVTHIHVNMNNVNNGPAVRPVTVIGQIY